MGNFLQSLPNVIEVSEGDGQIPSNTIADYKKAVADANRNADAGIQTEVTQAVKQGGNVLVNMVSQECYFQECTNTDAMVGKLGCGTTGNECNEFCTEQNAKYEKNADYPMCTCPKPPRAPHLFLTSYGTTSVGATEMHTHARPTTRRANGKVTIAASKSKTAARL